MSGRRCRPAEAHHPSVRARKPERPRPPAAAGGGRVPTLDVALRQQSRTCHRRGRAQPRRPFDGGDARRSLRTAPRGGDPILSRSSRGADADREFSGLGNPSVRHFLAAPGHCLRASCHAQPPLDTGMRRAHRTDHHAHGAYRPAHLSGRQLPAPRQGRQARSDRDARPARARRLPVRQPGDGARRVRGSWLAYGSLSDGQPIPPANRSSRRRNRQHPHFQCRDPALGRNRRRDPPAPGPRVSFDAGEHRPVPQPVAYPLRGRSDGLPGLSGCQSESRPCRHRVLPGAVFRDDRDALRLPARRYAGGDARGHARRSDALLGGDR